MHLTDYWAGPKDGAHPGLDLHPGGFCPAEGRVQVLGGLSDHCHSTSICYCRPKDLPFIANRRGLEEFYCPKIKKRRQERRNKSCSKLKRGKKKCRETLCIKKREKNNSDVTCTQKERDKKFGRGWKWNTRDCSSLPRRREVKKCRREKRRRCIRRHKAGGVTKQQAKLRCKSRG